MSTISLPAIIDHDAVAQLSEQLSGQLSGKAFTPSEVHIIDFSKVTKANSSLLAYLMHLELCVAPLHSISFTYTSPPQFILALVHAHRLEEVFDDKFNSTHK